MKRSIILLPLALLTFAAGLAVTRTCQQFAADFWAEGEGLVVEPPQIPASRGGMDVEYLGLVTTAYATYAEFVVTNGGAGAAYYRGYGRDTNCSVLVRQGRQVTPALVCACGTGLGEQALRAGEAARFRVTVPYDSMYPYEVGFDFAVGEGRRKVTVWSRRLNVPDDV